MLINSECHVRWSEKIINYGMTVKYLRGRMRLSSEGPLYTCQHINMDREPASHWSYARNQAGAIEAEEVLRHPE
jgi:hypothetical protein